MTQSFTNLGVSDSLTAGLMKAGITIPMEIQKQVIPLALSGKDIIAQSPTGTGKTLAYLTPILQKIDPSRRETQAMILAPTHELAIQIQRQVQMLAENSELPITATPLIGGVNIQRQIEKLKDKPHIVIGSGGRILELIQKRKINAQTIKTIVLDEADRLLYPHNLENIKAVIKTTLRDRQLMLFSATITAAPLEEAKILMREPQIIMLSHVAAPAISHSYLIADQRDKIEILRKLIRTINNRQALIFINKSDQIEIVVAKLIHHGLSVSGLHGSSVKADRKRALESFRNKKIQLLVASDVAARGLDIPGVEYIINLDIPEDPEVYLHRTGRTGRAGQAGMAISLASSQETPLIAKYERALHITISLKQLVRGELLDVKSR